MNQIKTTEINQLELEINFYREQTSRNIIEIGKRLIKAKELVPYGKWGEWLKAKVNFSDRRARQFMQVAREFEEWKTSSVLPLDKMLALTSIDKEERETFIEENPVEDMTTRELIQTIKENKELEQKIEELENQKPEVVVEEVVPEDYNYYKETTEKFFRLQDEVRDLKKELNNQENNKEDFNRLRKEYEEKVNESFELKQQIKNLVKEDSETKHQEKLKDSALIFCTRIHTFLNDVGGLAWLTDYLDELDDYDRRSYIKALNLLEGWVLTVKTNINKEEL